MNRRQFLLTTVVGLAASTVASTLLSAGQTGEIGIPADYARWPGIYTVNNSSRSFQGLRVHWASPAWTKVLERMAEKGLSK